LQGHELPGCRFTFYAASIDGHARFGSGPRGNTQIHSERFWLGRLELQLRRIGPRIFGYLGDGDRRSATRPGNSRRQEQVHINAVLALEIGADSVVCRQLWERAGTTRPFLSVVHLPRRLVVVRIVESGAVG